MTLLMQRLLDLGTTVYLITRWTALESVSFCCVPESDLESSSLVGVEEGVLVSVADGSDDCGT